MVKANNNQDALLSSAMTGAEAGRAIQQEWLSRSVEENLELLNEESKESGVYGFSYLESESDAVDIPGMTVVSYAVPDDPGGGVYVGYEPYQKTFERAQEVYKQSAGGAEAEQLLAEATAEMGAQKAAYEDYLSENPECPAYLDKEFLEMSMSAMSGGMSPVDAYASYEVPRMNAEAKVKEQRAAAGQSYSMDDVAEQLDAGMGTFMAYTADQYGQYADSETGVEAEADGSEGSEVPAQDYGVRASDDVEADTIEGMMNYSPYGKVLPGITAEPGTDEYGRQVVEQIKAVEEDLLLEDENYQKAFPEGMQYYAEGENPRAIPGMTLVVGRIEGCDGFYAGYESYDETYSFSTEALDARSDEIEKAAEEGTMSDAEITAARDEISGYRESAAGMYDMQKAQYEDYVDANPGNDFLAKEDAVGAYDSYQGALPVEQKCNDFIAGIKEFLSNAKDKLKDAAAWIAQTFSGGKAPGAYTAEEALAADAEREAKMAGNGSAEAQQQADAGSNAFKSIVDSELAPQQDYEYEYLDTAAQATGAGATMVSTGNQLLDELQHGSTQSVDALVANMKDSQQAKQKAVEDSEIYEEIPGQQAQNQKSDKGSRLGAWADKLASVMEQSKENGMEL